MKRWTEDQINILIKQYQSKGPKLLVPILDRSLKTISKKARRLGLSRGVSRGNKHRANSWQFSSWTYDIGYIVGTYLGDGNLYIKPNQTAYFKLDVIDQDFCQAVSSKIKKEIGYSGSIVKSSKEGSWTYRICNKDFVYWLRDEFGGPKNKTIKLLPTIESNKGMIEGLFDSEGTVTRYIYNLRMTGGIKVVEKICQQLNIQHGPLHKGIKSETWQSPDSFQGYSISNKEYTKAGLGTYIKRKAKHGLVLKSI